ncbi:MAG TPA: ATP-binding protein [Thermomicrobiales bacterium]|nr:ATP-binding protein [Thermomicrobiales bacterium]
MLPDTASSAHPPRLADRLAAARRGRFVGRHAELDTFRSALLAPAPPFAVLYLYGPGGIGKSSLLREYARIASEVDKPAFRIDGRNVDPSPPGFLRAVRHALQLDDGAPSVIEDWPPGSVLLIDTYEMLESLDEWLREVFLQQLPAETIVVIAGRNPPAAAWLADLDWSALTRTLPVRNLLPEESETYLATRGVPGDQHGSVLAFTHGHPLALALVADVLQRGNHLDGFDPKDEPDLLRLLLEHLVQDVPSPLHRRALEVSVMAWSTTEELLARVLDVDDAHELFEWMRRLSFIEHGAFGLFPHDLAREVLDEDLRWRSPTGRRELSIRLATCLHDWFHQSRGAEQQRVWFDLLYLYRHNPAFRPYFDWSAIGTAYAEPALPADHPAIEAMVLHHYGVESAAIARHWLARQPEAFLVYRDAGGDLFGFMAHLELQRATAEDIAADPATTAALEYVQRHRPARPDEVIAYLRFWMSREAEQGISPALNLTAINASIYWTTRQKLAWNFIALADPAFLQPHFTSIHMWRVPEADFEVGGRRFGIFAHDWRVETPAEWLQIKASLASDTAVATDARPSAPASVILSDEQHREAVRQALRDFCRPDLLAGNPLVGTWLVHGAAHDGAQGAALQSLLREAVETLASPKDLKFHRAIWHTYIEPAPTQELAAELLNLPFNTYRYHLARGIERIDAWLRQRGALGGDTI